ncbi:RagB/SusD family nutrient uptake outer membrane protein [Dawidia soli]|uniref:RagB/SusD family nutrient uptake outer membrane protein n=1 Tax=Dawidia soli TaxID=2782352 RepID=A0AAP2DBJ2_9BACT|nr:RagB/SusD family nutrient uptake outer membrane protein [Dawidia soli]MBT1686292.1 RagB/SusD family nutrient uptake outer membrane protein [Dawidia soli]
MKKIHLIILLAGLSAFSCSDFLEEEPKDEMSSDQFFSDRDHAFNAVNTLYRNGAPQMFDGSAYAGTPAIFFQDMSGFFDNQYKGQEVHASHAQQLTLNGTNISGYLDDRWAELYNGVARANFAIKNIATTPGLTEAEIGQLEGEARFFRAYAYYFLVRLFGEVPLITEPVVSLADEVYVGRSPIAAIYDQIEADLLWAVNESNMAAVTMATNSGRVTKGAAATLLAEVYLTMSGYPLQEDHYADAAAMARRVINGEFGSYSLTQHQMAGGNVDLPNSAYNQIRRADKTANEYIFYREYDAAITASDYPRWTVPAFEGFEDKVVKYSVVNGAYQPEDEFLNMYDPTEDLRIQEKQYFHTTMNGADGNPVTFRETPYIWFDENALFTTGNSGKDVAIFTYSDVLLIAAEAIAQSEGVTGEAVDYLTEVRARAYWMQDPADVAADLAGLATPEFVEEVWTERNRELVFEFKTWFDILRTQRYPQTSEANPGEVTYVDVVGATNPWGKTYTSTYLLLPLSNNERQRNPALGDNNPGYN